MKIATPTVMHSGTHTLRHGVLRAFNEAGGEQLPEHFVTRHMPRIIKNIAAADLTVCPIRHPERIMESFRRRYKPVYRKDERKPGLSFEAQWENFMSVADKAFLIHVDNEIRHDEIQELSKLVGINLTHDWKLNHIYNCTHGTATMDVTGDSPFTASWLNTLPT